jgi:flagellar motor component MotA
MNIPAILGLMVTIGLVLFGIALGSPLIIFVDASPTIIVVGGTFFLMLAAHGTAGPFTYTLGGMQRLLGLGSPAPWSPAERRMAVLVARSGGTSAILMGGLGGMIGLCQMLQNMEDPAKIGPAMAVALLTTFYAVVLNLIIFVPLARHFTEAEVA